MTSKRKTIKKRKPRNTIPTNGLRMKKIDPKNVEWFVRKFKYEAVLKKLKSLKIGEAMEVNVVDPYMISSTRHKCYQQVKGNYRIIARIANKEGKTYLMKTDK